MSSIEILELEGKQRRLVLVGGGLPLQGASWGGELMLEETWNPGSAVATQHVLGPMEAPSEWEGEWNTTRLIRRPPTWRDGAQESTLVLAMDLFRAMDALRTSGQLLRVTWIAKDNQRIARVGRLQKFVAKIVRSDDMTWSATFNWVGRVDASIAIVQSDQGLAAARALAQAATDAAARIEAQAFISANARLPGSATTFTLGQLEQLVEAPLQLAKDFAQFGKALTNTVNSLANLMVRARDVPYEIVQQLVDVASEAVGVSNRFTDEMSRESYESWTTMNTFRGLLFAASYYGDGTTGAQILAAAAQEAAIKAQQRKTAARRNGSTSTSLTGAGDIEDVVLPREGQTMTSIALNHYKEDLSYELSRANGLPGNTISPPPGKPLILPSLQILQGLRPL